MKIDLQMDNVRQITVRDFKKLEETIYNQSLCIEHLEKEIDELKKSSGPVMYDVKDVMKILNLKEYGARKVLQDPTLNTFRLGKKIQVEADNLKEYAKKNHYTFNEKSYKNAA